MDRLALDIPLLVIVLVAAVTDVRRGRVYNWLTYPAAVLGLVLNMLLPAGIGLGSAFLGLLVGFVPLFLAYLSGGLGAGDVKLMGAVGGFLGPHAAAYALLYTCIVGAVLCLMLIIAREGFAGIWLRLFGGRKGKQAPDSDLPDDDLPNDDLPELRFPFAVAVLLGVVWLLVEQYVGQSLIDQLLRT